MGRDYPGPPVPDRGHHHRPTRVMRPIRRGRTFPCMPTTARQLAAALAALTVAALLVACGGKNEPAVCTDVANIQKTVDDLKDVKIEAGAIGTIQTDLATMRQQLATLKTDAKAQFSGETAAVSTALDTLSTNVAAARASPSLTTLSAVGTAVAGVKDAASSLVSAVESTC